MKAFVLCGGFGTRIRSVIGETQKAVADIDGTPFLELIVKNVLNGGIGDVVLCTHYKSEQVESVASKIREKYNVCIEVIREPEPLGTGGALVNAIKELAYKGKFLALNADTYLAPEAYELVSNCAKPSLLVTQVDDAQRYGAVVLDECDKVVKLSEKNNTGPGYVSAGVYLFETKIFEELPPGNISLERDILPKLVDLKHLQAVKYNGPFIDIGIPEALSAIREIGAERL